MKAIVNREYFIKSCDYLGNGNWLSVEQVEAKLNEAPVENTLLIGMKKHGDCDAIFHLQGV